MVSLDRADTWAIRSMNDFRGDPQGRAVPAAFLPAQPHRAVTDPQVPLLALHTRAKPKLRNPLNFEEP